MPSALLRPCPGDGGRCGVLVASGRCQAHAHQLNATRGTAASRGYDHKWVAFRRRFVSMLVAAGIAPVCGAALPGGPSMQASRCKAEGRLNNSRLHLDHDPPLTEAERKQPRAVLDPLRVGFLCVADHTRKTDGEIRSRRA